MKTIIQRIESGDLNRDIDEKGAGGFWDLAGDRANEILSNIGIPDEKWNETYEAVQEMFYNDYWELYEEATGYVDPRDIPF